jgi:hypothetical protein
MVGPSGRFSNFSGTRDTHGLGITLDHKRLQQLCCLRRREQFRRSELDQLILVRLAVATGRIALALKAEASIPSMGRTLPGLLIMAGALMLPSTGAIKELTPRRALHPSPALWDCPTAVVAAGRTKISPSVRPTAPSQLGLRLQTPSNGR